MRQILLIAALFGLGCGHLDAAKGLRAAQTGLAIVDESTDLLAKEYEQAVIRLRAYCAGDPTCEETYRVSDADIAQVVEGAESASAAYDLTAEGVKMLENSWVVLVRETRAVKEAADALGK